MRADMPAFAVACMNARIHTYAYACMRVYACLSMHVCVHRCMRVRICTHIATHGCTRRASSHTAEAKLSALPTIGRPQKIS